MVDKKEFTRFQEAIKKTYKNPKLLGLLSGAKEETYISGKALSRAGMPSDLFNDLSTYVEIGSRGLRFTRHGKAVFDSQLLVDKQTDVIPMSEFFLECSSYGNG